MNTKLKRQAHFFTLLIILLSSCSSNGEKPIDSMKGRFEHHYTITSDRKIRYSYVVSSYDDLIINGVDQKVPSIFSEEMTSSGHIKYKFTTKSPTISLSSLFTFYIAPVEMPKRFPNGEVYIAEEELPTKINLKYEEYIVEKLTKVDGVVNTLFNGAITQIIPSLQKQDLKH